LTRKLWLSTLVVGVALLAVFAGGAAAKSGKSGAVGGTLNVDLPNDVDYTDPATTCRRAGRSSTRPVSS
jgi:hypothetical protein